MKQFRVQILIALFLSLFILLPSKLYAAGSNPTIVSIGNGTNNHTFSPAVDTIEPSTIRIGNVNIGDTVQIYLNNNNIGSSVSSGSTVDISINTPFTPGAYRFTAKVNNYSSPDFFYVYNNAITPAPIIFSPLGIISNTAPIPIYFAFNDYVVSLQASDIHLTNGTISSPQTSDGGYVYSANLTPSGNGPITIDLPAGVAYNDKTGRYNSAAPQFTITYDNIPPAAPAINSVDGITSSPAISSNSKPTVLLTNLENNTTYYLYDHSLGLISTNLSAGTSLGLTPNNSLTSGTYNFYAYGMDAAGNIGPSSPSFLYQYVPLPATPQIVSINGQTTTPAYGNLSNPAVVINNLSIGNSLFVYANGTQVANQIVGAVQISIGISLPNIGSYNIKAVQKEPTYGNYSSDSSLFNYTYDPIPPNTAITANVPGPTKTNPIPYTVVFSKPVTGFTQVGIGVSNGTVSSFSPQPDHMTYNFSVQPIGNGNVVVSIPQGVAQDLEGNGNLAAASNTIVYDSTLASHPVISSVGGISASPAYSTNGNVNILVTGILLGDKLSIEVGTSTILNKYDIGATAFTYNYQLPVESNYSITAVAYDALSGNVDGSSSPFLYTYDHTPPSFAISSTSSNPTSTVPIPFTIRFSEPVIGFDISDLSVGNGTTSVLATGDSQTYTVNITPTNEGDVSLSVAPNAVADLTGNNNTNSASLTIHYQSFTPSVVKLGDGSTDFSLGAGTSAVLVFNTGVSDISKLAVETAVLAGADNTPSLVWSPDNTRLTITANDLGTKFNNDVVVQTLTDTSSRIVSNLTLIDSALDSNQIAAGSDITLSNDKNQVVLVEDQPINITVPAGTTSPSINIDPLSVGLSATVPTISAGCSTTLGMVGISIPDNTIIAGSSGWDSVINLPVIKPNNTVNLNADPTKNNQIDAVIAIGSDNQSLSFNRGVRLVFFGQAGKHIGYATSSPVTEITSPCSSDSQSAGDALVPGSECKIDSGSNLVVWTKHFTSFVIFAQTDIGATPTPPSPTAALQNTNYSDVPSFTPGPHGAPVCTENSPLTAPKLFRVERPNKTTAKIFFVPAKPPISYYYIAYGLKEGDQRHGAIFNQGDYPGELSFTIKNLKPNVNYYFQVRGGNGCMPGPWSNWLSIKQKYYKETLLKKVTTYIKKTITGKN